MPNAWVAVDAGVDPLPWARLLRQAYRRTVEAPAEVGAPSSIIRPVVAESWRRSEGAGVSPHDRPPIFIDPAEARRRLDHHPLKALLPLIETVLVSVARYAGQVVAITDADGLILWTAGGAEDLETAERVHHMPGASWGERTSGTNAIGTSLVLDHPVQIFSAEQFKEVLHNWSSAAAPIHEPETGKTIGALSLSGPLKAAHPHGFSLVVAAARIVEVHLLHDAAQRDERLKLEYLEITHGDSSQASAVVNPAGRVLAMTPIGWLGARLRLSRDGMPLAPPTEEVTIESICGGLGFLVRRADGRSDGAGRPKLRLEAIGRARVEASLGGRVFSLSPRHGEILVILAHHPDGLDEERLAAALHEQPIKEVTVRAEISRLRKLLGSVIKTRPYRIAAEVSADFLEIEALLEAGAVDAAGSQYNGSLLASTKAPGVVAARERIEAALGGRSEPALGGHCAPALHGDSVSVPTRRAGTRGG